MNWKHMSEMLAAGKTAYTELKQLIVWAKPSASMGAFFRSQHELIFVWKSGTAPHINNFGLGETGRYRTNVWNYKGNAGFHRARDEELAAHPTVKPWIMVADAIRDCSRRGDIILDPFGGYGTTLIAGERTGRKARLIELDPLYCDATIRRWQKLTGKEAVLEGTGQKFAGVDRDRNTGGEDPDPLATDPDDSDGASGDGEDS
jgi:DNA modification methylase